MPLRDVTIRIKADVSGFTAGMARARASTSVFMRELEKSAAKRQALNELGSTMGKVGVAAGLAGAMTIRAFANFDQAMSKVKAALPEGAAGFDQLRKAAIVAGRDTQFSATEAALGVESLVKAGVSAKDILGGALSGALNVAAADNIDVATAADIAATALNQFKLKGTDATHVADLLAGTAQAAQGGVRDMAEALKYVGPVAQASGVSIDDTSTAIGLLAKRGILGGTAGANLRAMFIRLSGAGRGTQKVLSELNIDFADSHGKFIGVAAAMERLQGALAGKTDTKKTSLLARLFGVENVTAAQILLDSGPKGFAAMAKAIDDQASAAEIAHTKMDNLLGDLELLKGSLETAFIGTGQGSASALRGPVEDLTTLVNAYTKLPPAMQSASGGMVELIAILGLGGFAITRTVTGIASMRQNLNTLGATMTRQRAASIAFKGGLAIGGLALGQFIQQTDETSRSVGTLGGIVSGAAAGSMFGPWGAAIGGAVGALEGFGSAQHAVGEEVDGLRTSLDGQTTAITENTKAFVANKLEKSGALEAAGRLGVNPSDLVDASTGDPRAQRRVNRQLAPARARVGNETGPSMVRSQEGQDLAKVTHSMGRLSTETEKAQASQKRLNQALAHLSPATVDKVAAATRGIPKNVVAKFTTPGAPGAIKNAVAVARAAHLTPKQVTSVLTLLNFTPKQIAAVNAALEKTGKAKPKPKMDAEDKATSKINAVQKALLDLAGVPNVEKTITVTTIHRTTTRKAGGGAVLRRSAGGAVWGAGTSTSDSIDAKLSDGEHVVPTSEVEQAGGQAGMYRMRALIRSGDLKFSTGGAVTLRRALDIARLRAEIDSEAKALRQKGDGALSGWSRKVAILELAENRAALNRLLYGGSTGDPSDAIDQAQQAIADARNAPVSLFDRASDSPWMSGGGGFAARATEKLAQIRTLAGKLYKLRKLGLNGALLSEIYGLGSRAGIAAADELLTSPSQISALNAAFSGIQQTNAFAAALGYQGTAAGGGVFISVKDLSVDLAKMAASMQVVATDAAGHILASESWTSTQRG